MSDQGEGGVVCTWGDTTLYRDDLALLLPNNWLNDRLLGFYFEYLTTLYVSPAALAPRVLLLNPSSLMILNFVEDPSELALAFESLNFSTKQMVLVPINNNSDVSRAGGSHWSLLVYWRGSGFFSLDSYGDMNKFAARQAANQLAKLTSPERSPVNVVSVSVPQQTNGSDCGVYTLEFAESILKELVPHLKSTQQLSLPAAVLQQITAGISPSQMKYKRKQISDLIGQLTASSVKFNPADS